MQKILPHSNPYFNATLKVFILFILSTNTVLSAAMNDTISLNNKVIPESILTEVTTALSHYPDLANTPIEFKFKSNIKKSFMQAQPKFIDIFKNKKKRTYYIMISESITIEDEVFNVAEVPVDVLIGWIGHELGHIMDYRERSGLNMLMFGIRYMFFKGFIKEAEIAADTYAVNHGMGAYILATKDFILNHTSLSENYKNRIKRLYMSPDEIMLLLEELQETEAAIN